MTQPRILFAGTPEISVPLLKALAARFEVVGVLTSCDKSSGRSSKLVPSPVKAAALELAIERWGRRTLMLLGAGGLGLIYFVLGLCYWQGMTGVMMVILVVHYFFL